MILAARALEDLLILGNFNSLSERFVGFLLHIIELEYTMSGKNMQALVPGALFLVPFSLFSGQNGD
jgi:hypothetical protein